MKKIIGWGHQRYEIIPWQDADVGSESIEFSSRLSAKNFLNRFLHDTAGMQAMREILYGDFLLSGISQSNDNDIIQHLADRIISGHIKIISPKKIEGPRQATAVAGKEPVLTPVSAIKKRTDAPLKPLPASVDPALIAQAETLKMAAVSGTPFCEQ